MDTGHVLIIADFEGITTINEATDNNLYQQLYNNELLSIVESVCENGFFNIIVCDAHNKGDMIKLSYFENINPSAHIKIVSHLNNIPFNIKYDCAILVGLHGKENSDGILSHTFRFDFKEICLFNSAHKKYQSIGEVEIYCRWLGNKGIPVILVTGDCEAIYEANFYNPYRQVCCVKSLFQQNEFNNNYYYLYEKLKYNIDISLKLNWNHCISTDNEKVYVDFYNKDIFNELKKLNYNNCDDKLIFDNCSSFIDKLFILFDDINQAYTPIYESNIKFINKISPTLKNCFKNGISLSEISMLLNKSLSTLSYDDRIIITDWISKNVNLKL